MTDNKDPILPYIKKLKEVITEQYSPSQWPSNGSIPTEVLAICNSYIATSPKGD